jgi:ABC-type antimicrobial peptide transport system permease subunit
MSFLQFAWNNVRRNARAYLAYFLSSSFAVMIFFTYAIFIFHPDLEKSDLGEMVKIGMQAANYVVFLFSFLFVLYSVSSFLKARKKEFGLLTILGAEKKQMNRLIFLENMIIGFASIVTGLAGGLLLAKLFLVIGAKVVEMGELPLYLPWKAMGITLAAFLGLFLFISLFTPFFVRQNRVLELLQGTSKPKSEPKASILLSLLSASSLIGAFYLMKQALTNEKMILILLLGMIGTYFFFTQLSVLVVHLLKKNRSFFWRGTNLLWVSEMAYKMKDNARMFFMVTIVITMASSAIGIVLSSDQKNKQEFAENPFPFSYKPYSYSEENWQSDVEKIDQELSHAGVKYEKIETAIILREMNSSRMAVMKQSDYNRLVDVLQLEKNRPLNLDEAILVISKFEPDQKKAELKNLNRLVSEKNTLTVVKRFEKDFFSWLLYSVVVVADVTFDHLKQGDPENIEIQISYVVPAWSNYHFLSSNSVELKLSKKLTNWSREERQQGEAKGIFSSRAEKYLLMKQVNNVMSFIGIFIAAIFSIFTASLLYFKLYTDLDQDRHIYHGLSKIGLSTKEMKKAATIQMAILFFIPLFVAALETAIILSTLGKGLDIGDTFIPTIAGIGAFFVAQLVYFFVIRSRYLAQLQRVMV